MSEGQRRRVLDTGFGTNLLSAFTGQLGESLARKQKAQEELKLAFAKALAEAKIKSMFPSEEDRAKMQASQYIQDLNPEPEVPTLRLAPGLPGQTTFTPRGGQPTPVSRIESNALREGGYGDQVSTPEARKNRLLELFAQRQGEFQTAQQDRKMKILSMMQERGLLPSRTSGTSFYLNPGTGTASPITTPEGKPVTGKVLSGGYAGVTSKDDVMATVEGIKNGDIPPDPSQVSFRDRTRVNAELERQGINLSKLRNDWTSTQAFSKNANSSMQLRMRQALESVGQGIDTLRTLSQDFGRTGWTPANALVLKAAMTGTDPTRRDQATKFITQVNVMKDELAQGFMGGGVPTDRAFKLADEVMQPLYGNTQLNAALDQLRTNLNIRLNAINSLTPVMVNSSPSQETTVSSPSSTSPSSAESAKARLRAKYGR